MFFIAQTIVLKCELIQLYIGTFKENEYLLIELNEYNILYIRPYWHPSSFLIYLKTVKINNLNTDFGNILLIWNWF